MNKSYLKYAGGKSRILPTIIDLIYDHSDYVIDGNLTNYIEPFVGSGAVILNVNAYKKIGADINWDIINCHRMVIAYPQKVMKECQKLWENATVGGKYDNDLYLKRRLLFREEWPNTEKHNIKKAALLIYLNRFGFNGMFRYSKANGFNVPVGKMSGGSIPSIPEDTIQSFGPCMDVVVLECRGYWDTIKSHCTRRTTIYCDPPYLNAGGGEIQYNGLGFSMSDHINLAKIGECLRSKGCRMLISNHDIPKTRELYRNATRIVEVDAFRSISRKGDGRKSAKELVAIYE